MYSWRRQAQQMDTICTGQLNHFYCHMRWVSILYQQYWSRRWDACQEKTEPFQVQLLCDSTLFAALKRCARYCPFIDVISYPLSGTNHHWRNGKAWGRHACHNGVSFASFSRCYRPYVLPSNLCNHFTRLVHNWYACLVYIKDLHRLGKYIEARKKCS